MTRERDQDPSTCTQLRIHVFRPLLPPLLTSPDSAPRRVTAVMTQAVVESLWAAHQLLLTLPLCVWQDFTSLLLRTRIWSCDLFGSVKSFTCRWKCFEGHCVILPASDTQTMRTDNGSLTKSLKQCSWLTLCRQTVWQETKPLLFSATYTRYLLEAQSSLSWLLGVFELCVHSL